MSAGFSIGHNIQKICNLFNKQLMPNSSQNGQCQHRKISTLILLWISKKNPLLKSERNCLNIIVFFQWDKCNGNVIETNKMFPLHVHNIPLSQYLLQSLLLCALSACFPKTFVSSSLLGRLLTLRTSACLPFPVTEKTAASTTLRNSTSFIEWLAPNAADSIAFKWKQSGASYNFFQDSAPWPLSIWPLCGSKRACQVS